MKEFSLTATDESGDMAATGSFSGAIARFFYEGAKAWNLSRTTVILIFLTPFFICLFGAATALMGKSTYKWLTGEDRFGENLQVLFWCTSFFLSLWVVQKEARDGRYLFAGMYAFLCVGIFFIIGEEISWGQRIFGWATPEAMQEINKQDETNIHNLQGVGDTIKWLHLVVGAYGTIAPLLVLGLKGLRPYRNELSKLVPHLTLLPFFVIPFVWRIYRNFFDVPKRFYFVISEYTEVIEVVIAAAFMFFLFFQNRQIKKTKGRAK